jgi:hypothetical protein
MLLHLDGSSHAWLGDSRRYDLLVCSMTPPARFITRNWSSKSVHPHSAGGTARSGRPTRRKRGAAVSEISALGKGGSRRSCVCVGSPRSKKPIVSYARSTWRNLTGVLWWPRRSLAVLFCRSTARIWSASSLSSGSVW